MVRTLKNVVRSDVFRECCGSSRNQRGKNVSTLVINVHCVELGFADRFRTNILLNVGLFIF